MKHNRRIRLGLLCNLLLVLGCAQLQILRLNRLELTQLAVADHKLYILGELNSQSYDQVTAEIEANPQITTIVLTANPGSLDDETTFELARYIRSKNLDTHLINQSVIASGAVDLFLSGVRRTMEEDAQLGVHSWSDGSTEAKDVPREHEDHRLNADYIADMLGSEDFYWFTIYAAPADAISWMTHEDIEKYGLLTAKVAPPSDDPTPFGTEFLELRQEILED